MPNDILPYALLCLAGVFLSSLSQVLLKKAAMRHYDSVIREYLNPLVIFAYAIFFSTTLLSVFAYKGMPLSLGPVLETTSYLYITLFGFFIFKEKQSVRKVFALIIIVIGMLIYALA